MVISWAVMESLIAGINYHNSIRQVVEEVWGRTMRFGFWRSGISFYAPCDKQCSLGPWQAYFFFARSSLCFHAWNPCLKFPLSSNMRYQLRSYKAFSHTCMHHLDFFTEIICRYRRYVPARSKRGLQLVGLLVELELCARVCGPVASRLEALLTPTDRLREGGGGRLSMAMCSGRS